MKSKLREITRRYSNKETVTGKDLKNVVRTISDELDAQNRDSDRIESGTAKKTRRNRRM